MDLRLLSYNIRSGARRRVHLLAETFRHPNPSLAILQEATNHRIVKAVARAADAPLWASRKGWSVAFLSRMSDLTWGWHKPSGMRHGFMEVTLPTIGITIFGIHLYPRLSKWAENRRLRELDFILAAASSPRMAGQPHLLTGDFNTLAPEAGLQVNLLPSWIRTLIRVSGGRVPTRVVQRLRDAGYVDSFRHHNKDLEGYTFPAPSPMVRLDYLFLSPGLSEHLNSCRVIGEPDAARHASDHLPLLSVFTF